MPIQPRKTTVSVIEADVGSFDRTREMANLAADYMRLHGPFMPHRLGPEEMEYNTPTSPEETQGSFQESIVLLSLVKQEAQLKWVIA